MLAAVLPNQLNSVGTLGAALGATGGAVGTALAHLPQTVQTAVGQLAAGNVAGAADALLQIPLTPGLPLQNLLPALATIITKPLENIVNVVKAFTDDTLGTELILAGFIGPLISTPAAAATAIQNVISAAGTGNPMAVVGALLAAPATVADGLLNGGYGPDLGPLVDSPFPVKAGGLLSSSTLVFNPDGTFFVNTGGPIAALEQVLAKIAGALAPKPTAAVKTADVASVPSTAATTVTLSTGTTAAPAPAKEATTASEATAPKPSSTETKTEPSVPSAETQSPTTTKDSKPETDSTTKPTDTGTDVTSGNKVEPKPAGGSEATKTGNATGSTTTQESTTEKTDTASTSSTATSGGAEKSAEKGASTARHAHAK